MNNDDELKPDGPELKGKKVKELGSTGFEKRKEEGGLTVTELDKTLGDVQADDRDNFDHIMKKAKAYRFRNMQDAHNFMRKCLDAALNYCGVIIQMDPKKPNMGIGSELFDTQLEKQNVKVEHRPYPPSEPLYQTGLYVYKNNEMVHFVSNVFTHSNFQKYPFFNIRTTVPHLDLKNMDTGLEPKKGSKYLN